MRNFFEEFFFTKIGQEEAEFIPLLSKEDEEKMNGEAVPEVLAILPLRNTVLFPGVVIPITVGRDKSIKLINEAYKSPQGLRIIGVVAQKDSKIEEPTEKDLYNIGTVAKILKLLKMPDGSTTAIIQGKRRFLIKEVLKNEPYIQVSASPMNEIFPKSGDVEFEALVASLKELALQIIKLSPNIPSEASFAINNIESNSFLINFISSNINAPVSDKQKLLEEQDIKKRAKQLLKYLTKELQMLEIQQDIQSKARSDIIKQQREYFLHQQMKTIQEELGENPLEQEINDIKKKAAKKKWSKEVKEHFNKEVAKLERMNPAAAEYSVQMNYLETLIELPWNEYTKDNFNIKRAEKILDHDHYGLEKVKKRILEHLAILKLKGDMKAPILCFYGPPGVGKTSLGRSIAKALTRKYVRMSLGGLHDEAEIRGHRKTYIGAMPGRIIQSLKKAKSCNPVFMLDEIDKVANDFRGDPSSALLEVLDPEQNNTFYDNFLEIEYDLSKVLFIATANNLSTIQPALLDRMEVIEIPGYAVEEKIEIAKKHLIPKLLKTHGLKKEYFKISKKVIERIIEDYTREAGVRDLEKKLSKLIRHNALFVASEEEFDPEIKIKDLEKILGPAHAKDKYQGNDVIGVVTGLAWTTSGGEILFVETSLSKGKGDLTLTGNLGEVMKESAKIALQFLKAHSEDLHIDPDEFSKLHFHIHVPEGAVPKDGPSAGITMLTSLASSLKKQKVKKGIAMSGEITLRGKILAVGGIQEKVLAAKRAGIKEVILPKDNEKDVKEIKQQYVKGLKFTYFENMIDLLKYVLNC